ncbi:hypothetical protein [Maridesulfovibrio sp. FT414]|uniref:hypothetical protein n=1 Tax=Maridesulfovibrio sp. FT414 TaxID=2979469 RepID=UPI003D803867
MKKIVFAVLMVVVLASAALAEDNYNRCFYSMDRNGDDAVSKEEFSAALPESGQAFGAADADKSGSIDHDEWEAFKESKGIRESHG